MQDEHTNDYTTPRELAAHYETTAETIRRWIHAGAPHVMRGRGRYLARRADIDQWLTEQNEQRRQQSIAHGGQP